MERARHRRSKSVSGLEGTRQVQKQNAISRLSPDWNNMFMPELGLRSFGPATGMPMKKLLAEEMSREVEPKRQSPSVIARLMGLEMMPPTCHGNARRQQKGSPTSGQKSVSVSRRTSTDQQEYKDVYEDLEASHILNRRCSPRWHGNSVLTRPVHHLSTDPRFQDLKELYGTSEMLDANSDLLLQFLQQPNSLSVNSPVDSRGSDGCRIAVLKPLNSVRNETNSRARRPHGDVVKKHHVTSHLTREDGLLLESHNCHRVHTSHLSKLRSDENNEKYMLPTKVVLLKPNPRTLNSSHDYQLSCKENNEFTSVRGSETLPRTSPGSNGIESSIPISKKARGIAREIAKKMRNGRDAIKGYAGDESSYDGTESESESESEGFRLPSRMSFNDNNLCRYPCSYLGQSSVSREAKKQISDRWKITRKYQDMEMNSKGSTLGDMLSLSERETRRRFLNAKASLGRPSDRLVYNGRSVMCDRPFGIHTRDVWSDEIVKGLSRSRSRSMPPSRDRRSPRRSTHNYNWIEDKPMIHSGCVCHGRSKAVERNKKEYNSPKDSNSSSEASFEIQMESITENLAKQQSIFETITEEEDMQKSLVPDLMIAEPESPELYSKSSADDFEDPSLQELPEQVSSSLQCLETDPDPSNDSKEADHSSPVSVLEVPFTEEDTPSTYESFERVSAGLHELRMQLQLLKMESGGCTEDTFIASEGNYTPEPEDWESCYTNDILTDSILSRTTWHSPESPLDPKLFDFLENKYSDSTRSERRLLFDRVNSAVLEIFGVERVVNLRKEDVIENLMKKDFGRDDDDGVVRVLQQQWEEGLKGGVEVIGNEIEKMILDDILMEVVCY